MRPKELQENSFGRILFKKTKYVYRLDRITARTTMGANNSGGVYVKAKTNSFIS